MFNSFSLAYHFRVTSLILSLFTFSYRVRTFGTFPLPPFLHSSTFTHESIDRGRPEQRQRKKEGFHDRQEFILPKRLIDILCGN